MFIEDRCVTWAEASFGEAYVCGALDFSVEAIDFKQSVFDSSGSAFHNGFRISENGAETTEIQRGWQFYAILRP